MTVETLVSKDPRLADFLQERNALNKVAVDESVGRETLQQILAVKTVKNEQADNEKAVAQEEVEAPVVKFDNNQIRDTLEQINKVIPIANTKLIFEFDELGDPPIIKVIDKTSNELIREIPSQDLVKVAQAFSEMADNLTKAGALINFQA
ncbi:flagellar protein FlaG [Rheinheimera baltica]|uniref:flagellar protein FlaG n=1 Tax=Rheinheimera baltica TaxID=67576 RepID=UPI00273E3247|nr:flagellar protein FlaG [Rheinheimera baltica]MDP5143188.1 flagellar protein FlaG [Rheinheimera baltica]MDP5149899.1 flagellar protein FlaG [Rheinheimera baltica]